MADAAIDLPVFPSSAQEVVSLCRADDVDYKKLVTVIRRDPTLAAHFLGVANSPAFGARVPMVSLQQAVTRLGVTQTKQIALVIACKTKAFAVPGRAARAREILAHALGTALFAQEIARKRRMNVEEAFLTGLLHDIGRPALLQLGYDVCAADGIAVDDDAVEQCASDLHEQVGGTIATRWTMPKAVVDVVVHHHTPLTADSAPTPGNLAIATVQLADALVRGALGAKELAAQAASTLLNLYPEDIEALVAMRPSFLEQSGGMA